MPRRNPATVTTVTTVVLCCRVVSGRFPLAHTTSLPRARPSPSCPVLRTSHRPRNNLTPRTIFVPYFALRTSHFARISRSLHRSEEESPLRRRVNGGRTSTTSAGRKPMSQSQPHTGVLAGSEAVRQSQTRVPGRHRFGTRNSPTHRREDTSALGPTRGSTRGFASGRKTAAASLGSRPSKTPLLSSFPLQHTRILRARPRLLGPPPSLVPRPFWACLRSLGQSGERTRLLLVNVTGGAFPPLSRKPRRYLVPAPHRGETLLLTIRRFGGKPRRSRTLPAGVVSTRCRWLWFVVREVAL